MKSELKITFGKSNSRLLGKVINMATKMERYSFKNEVHEILFSAEDLMLKWESFYKIYGLTCSWKSFSLYINNEEIQPDKVNRLVNEIKEVVACFSRYIIYQQKDLYCNLSPFGCVNVKSINLNPESYGNFWYLYGHFEQDATKWMIHKKEIQLIIEEEIERKQLRFCPVFTTDKISQVIESLPEFIDLVKEKENWTIVYEKRFVGTAVVDIPKSIRHVLKPTGYPEYFLEEEDNVDNEITDDDSSGKEESDVNPFEGGTNEWANWEIENYLKKNLPSVKVRFRRD